MNNPVDQMKVKILIIFMQELQEVVKARKHQRIVLINRHDLKNKLSPQEKDQSLIICQKSFINN